VRFVVFELDVDVHVAVIARLATGEGTEDAHASGSERAQFGIVGLNDGQRVRRTVSVVRCAGPSFKQGACAERLWGQRPRASSRGLIQASMRRESGGPGVGLRSRDGR